VSLDRSGMTRMSKAGLLIDGFPRLTGLIGIG
jgi:hypothetical protein